MSQNKFNHEKQIGEIDFYKVETFTILMRKVYVWMTLALIITGITAYGGTLPTSKCRIASHRHSANATNAHSELLADHLLLVNR